MNVHFVKPVRRVGAFADGDVPFLPRIVSLARWSVLGVEPDRSGKGVMIAGQHNEGRRQPFVFLASYALAWAGGSIAYTPFLTLLLPLRFTEFAGDADVSWLALCATLGAIAAGLSNIAWGWASDRWPRSTRRLRLRWSAVGLAATAIGAVAIVRASDPLSLLIAVAGWQVALNLMLAPLSAYAADSVDDQQKGALGGMLSFAPALAAVAVVGVSLVPGNLAGQMALIMLLVVGALLPLMLRKTAQPFGITARSDCGSPVLRPDIRSLWTLWFARLFVQIAEGLLFLFVFYFLRSVSNGTLSLSDYAWTNAAVQLAAIPVALAVGRLSDVSGRRKLPLLAMLMLITIGLAGMALSRSWSAVVLSYAVFLTGSNAFLALHSAFAMQQLPDSRHFGRDLGLFNLTNTLPSLTSPLIAAIVIGRLGYHGLLGLLAVMMIFPAMLLWRLKIR